MRKVSPPFLQILVFFLTGPPCYVPKRKEANEQPEAFLDEEFPGTAALVG